MPRAALESSTQANTECEPNTSMRRFSKMRQKGMLFADFIGITSIVFKFSRPGHMVSDEENACETCTWKVRPWD